MHTGFSLASSTHVIGPYAVQGSAQKLVEPVQLQLPWLETTQAAPGALRASAHSESVVQAMQSPPPELQKLAPPVVG
jgi:hypothetical protein